MGTTQVAATLFQVQQLDLDLDRLTAEQQAITGAMQGSDRLRTLRTEYDTAQQQWRAGQQTQKEVEWTLEDLSQRLQQQERRLYNGTMSNPKELQTLQQEVQRLRGQKTHQEDVVLEVIETTETLQETVGRKQQALQQGENEWQQELNTLLARNEQLEGKRKELQEKRRRLTGGLNETILQRYESLRRTRQGKAVAKVEQNSCQWCRVILTPSELQHVRISAELQTCTNCGRILYYDR